MTPDDQLLELLRAVEGVDVYDGHVEPNEGTKVISVPLPYLVYYSTPGYDRDPRHSGDVAGRVLEFGVTGVGESREQAKWALDRARAVLSRRRLGRARIRRDDTNLRVRRDDDFTRPGGEPLFYGVDNYAVGV